MNLFFLIKVYISNINLRGMQCVFSLKVLPQSIQADLVCILKQCSSCHGWSVAFFDRQDLGVRCKQSFLAVSPAESLHGETTTHVNRSWPALSLTIFGQLHKSAWLLA